VDSIFYTRTIIYMGIILFAISIIANFMDVLPFVFSQVLHVVVFLIALWYFIWHFLITKGHRASYDRIAEGMILLMIIYNPFKPFLLEVPVWMFLDFVFLWVFMLYISEIRGIERNQKDGVQNWGNTGEELA